MNESLLSCQIIYLQVVFGLDFLGERGVEFEIHESVCQTDTLSLLEVVLSGVVLGTPSGE